ncbi:MAG: filamentous hemagglutinin N-terminal domain-containing protein, partial [Elainellaceae cyanobacterium]
MLPLPALAQSLIVPDDTLGDERSQVLEDFGTFDGQPVEVIQGGARRGQNLFHSFEEFNVDDGRGAFFFSPADTETIFSRVTGNNPSNILGVLGTFGDALPDLFFINPNGIIFGENATLVLDGSFVATTADAIQFGERGFFSANTPEAPSELLTIDPSAFLFSQPSPGDILNTAVEPVVGLRVPDGRSLILLGGNVTLDASQAPEAGDGGVSALGGRVELGGLLGTGTVGLDIEGDLFSLTFPQDVPRANVSIVNGAGVNAINISDGDGGAIAIRGNNIDILGESILLSGISASFENPDGQSGDVIIDATGDITIADNSQINNSVAGLGDSGDIRITASSVTISDGSVVSAVFGEGDSGIVSIAASDALTMTGGGTNIASTVSSFTLPGFPTIPATGGEGEINFEARQIIIEDGPLIATTSISGEADVGNVSLAATESIRLDGAATNIQSATSGQGDAGNIVITAPVLEVLNGASLFAVADDGSIGDAGDVIITASDRVTFSGFVDGEIADSIVSTVEVGAVGNGGSVMITTGNLELLDGSQIQTSTSGQGNAGRVALTARDRITI